MPSATVYLTDGFVRLDLPGLVSEFTLDAGWIARGTPVRWTWPHTQPGTAVGMEIVLHRDGEPTIMADFDDEPVVVKKGQEIVVRPTVSVD